MKHAFLDLIQERRTRYDLTNKSTLSKEGLMELVQTAVKHTPSAFNSQSARALVLCGDKHRQFWQIARHELAQIVPADKFGPTEEKLAAFSAAYGTILFFEDWSIIEGLQHQFPTYKDHFPFWAYQGNAMAEFAVWSALAENGMGASLQHYNPLVDLEVHQQFHVPLNWKLIAQMPFGVPLHKEAPDKTFVPIEERVKMACH
ncbi:MAG: nitroreductase family protein [Elusimicrobiaceae bacterium]|nr:nitroreductase family protein [Elusimicrobiaceae bacterium]